MSEPASVSAGIAGRYATAAFDIAREDGSLGQLEADVDALDAALKESADFRALIASPIYAREEQAKAIAAIAAKMGLGTTMTRVLGLMAAKRRLFVIPQLVKALRDRISAEKGEVTAEVVSATPLTSEQSGRLAETLSRKVGSDVKILQSVDESLIGGMVVKVGSRMIDTSIRSKLASLQNIMKEAR